MTDHNILNDSTIFIQKQYPWKDFVKSPSPSTTEYPISLCYHYQHSYTYNSPVMRIQPLSHVCLPHSD